MITKNDCLLLLNEIKKSGTNTDAEVKKLLSSTDIPLDIIAYINSKRQLDLTNFYERIRKNYNNKKSILYKNIVKEDLDNPNEVLTTLSSLNLQILLYAKDATDRLMFLKHARAKEISLVLTKYFTDYDLSSCIKLLKLIKADLKACEMICKSSGVNNNK